MTTTVTILNRGPKKVKVETQGRDAKGHFTQQDEHVVHPHCAVDVLVHPHQTFQVIEYETEEEKG